MDILFYSYWCKQLSHRHYTFLVHLGGWPHKLLCRTRSQGQRLCCQVPPRHCFICPSKTWAYLSKHRCCTIPREHNQTHTLPRLYGVLTRPCSTWSSHRKTDRTDPPFGVVFHDHQILNIWRARGARRSQAVFVTRRATSNVAVKTSFATISTYDKSKYRFRDTKMVREGSTGLRLRPPFPVFGGCPSRCVVFAGLQSRQEIPQLEYK